MVLTKSQFIASSSSSVEAMMNLSPNNTLATQIEVLLRETSKGKFDKDMKSPREQHQIEMQELYE